MASEGGVVQAFLYRKHQRAPAGGHRVVKDLAAYCNTVFGAGYRTLQETSCGFLQLPPAQPFALFSESPLINTCQYKAALGTHAVLGP